MWKIKKDDCMFLISEEQFLIFQSLTEEFQHLFLTFPAEKDTYLHSVSILDVWYVISTEPKNRLDHIENTMIYPYRLYCLSFVKDFQIKLYIRLALYENKRLAFICAFYIFKELDEFLVNKMPAFGDLSTNYELLMKYAQSSMRPFYAEKLAKEESYPKDIAILQVKLTTELDQLRQQYLLEINEVTRAAIDEACIVYETEFGLINDWDGLVK